MSKLDEIEARAKVGDAVMPVEDAKLLTRAVRQLGAERKAYQALYEATDDNLSSLSLAEIYPDLIAAFKAMDKVAEPDPDVLELIVPNQEGKE